MAGFDPTKYGAKLKTVSPVYPDISDSGLEGGVPLKPNLYGANFRYTGNETPLQAGLKAAGNLPSSALNLGKGVVGAVAHPVQTGKGLFNVAVGGVQKLLPGQGDKEEYADAIIQFFKERYGSLEAASQTAVEDPVGLATDVLSVFGGGAALAGKTAQAGKLGSLIASPITKPAGMVGKGLRTTARELSTGAAGITTGVGKEAFKEALSQTPFKAQKGSMLEVVNEARSGFQKVKIQRGAAYKDQLENIKTKYPQSLSIEPVIEKARELIAPDAFNIKRLPDGTFDLSRSPLVGNEKKVEALFGVIDEWGLTSGDRTVIGIDKLKQQLREFREPTNPRLNFFIDQLANAAKDSIKKSSNKALVDDYVKLTSEYEKSSDFIDELQRTLSLGENSTPDTAITKLNSLMTDNKEYRRFLAEELERATGKDILGEVSKQQLKSFVPKGLAKYVTGAVGLGGAFSGGIPLLPLLAVSSPRIMGEFFRAIGATDRFVSGVLSDINNLRVAKGLKKIGLMDEEGQLKAGLSIEDVSKKGSGAAGTPETVSKIPKELQSLAEEAKKYKSAEEFVKGKKVDVVLDNNKIIDMSKTESQLPKVPEGFERFYRAESPTIKHGDAWGEKGGMLPSGFKEGDSFHLTPDIKYANYYKDTYGKDAKISYFDLPKGLAKASDKFEGEFTVTKSQLTDLWNKAAKEARSGLREGQPPIGSDWNEATKSRIDLNETVARERFDIPNLKKVSFGGSDRDVYELPNDRVLKVAKSSRGLTQNSFSSDYYAENAELIPQTIERGKNYIVKEKVSLPDMNTKKMVSEIKEIGSFYPSPFSHRDAMPNRQKAYEIMNKYGYSGDDLANYDVLWGDIQAIRNWGTKNGKPILLDEGTLFGDLNKSSEKIGGKNLTDPEFRDSYYQSRAAKKRFGDIDKKTMYGVGGFLLQEEDD